MTGCAPSTTTTTASTTIVTSPGTTLLEAVTSIPTSAGTTWATTTTSPPMFLSSVGRADIVSLGHSWHDGCPLGVERLRSITLTHWGFDGKVHTGELIIHEDHVEDVVSVFGALFSVAFPIQSIVPIGELPEGAEDAPGYANTSGFHCRFVHATTRWSEHAFGRAIDLNPHLNPLVSEARIWPTGSERYADRGLDEPGMILAGDEVVEAFAAIGWEWGGDFRSFKDYHHFSATGR